MRASIAIIALAGCGLGGDEWSNVSFTPESVAVRQLVSDSDGVPLAVTTGGILRYDGDSFVPRTSALPPGTDDAPVRVGADHTICVRSVCAGPGEMEWTDIGLTMSANQSPFFDSTGAMYAVAEGVLQERIGGAWQMIQAPFPDPDTALSDERGAVYLETNGYLHVLKDHAVRLATRSRGLMRVGPDGTLYYFIEATPKSLGRLVARTLDGEETIVSDGECEDDNVECPSFDAVNYPLVAEIRLRPGGGFYHLFATYIPNSTGPIYTHLMRLDPGSRRWRPHALLPEDQRTTETAPWMAIHRDGRVFEEFRAGPGAQIVVYD